MEIDNKDQELAPQIIPYLDLTALAETVDEDFISKLCQLAKTPYGDVAAICVNPQNLSTVKKHLDSTTIKIVTVANFPGGSDDIETTILEIQQALAGGAHEIDVVMPYQTYLAGYHTAVKDFVSACKQACQDKLVLKIILETGAFKNSSQISEACQDLLEAGADFLKTSTGKFPVGVNLASARAILLAIKEWGKPTGFKAAGGIRTFDQAYDYLALAKEIMGQHWVTVDNFRIGSSQLISVNQP